MVSKTGVGEGGPLGRRSRSYSRRGEAVRPASPGRGHGIHLLGTLLAAAERGATVDSRGIEFEPRDLRGAIRLGTEANLVVFVVDASGSVAAKDRLKAVTGACISILQDAYRRRDRVAVISVRGKKATVLVPPTRSVDIAVSRLSQARVGGKTPLASGLEETYKLIDREVFKSSGLRSIAVVLTDGRATDGLKRVNEVAGALASRKDVGCVVIDCEAGRGRVRLNLAADVARALGAPVLSISDFKEAGAKSLSV
nr:VWA domain-containing protein [Corynebacterium glucuronolyticum]